MMIVLYCLGLEHQITHHNKIIKNEKMSNIKN